MKPPGAALVAAVLLAAGPSAAEIIHYESFESPAVSGFDDNTVPDNAVWIGSTEGYGATNRGLYNEEVVWPATPLFETPYGRQGYKLNYSNSGLTTAQNAFSEVVTEGVTYRVSFNVATEAGAGDANYIVELLAFEPTDTNTDRRECRGNRPGTVLATAQGVVSSTDMSHVDELVFTPQAGDPSLGKEIGIRLLNAPGPETYDNIRFLKGHDMAPSPANGITTLGGNLPLSWTNHAPNTGSDVWVDVWFGTDPQNLTKVVDAALNASTTTVNVPSAATYYWRVDSYLDGSSTGTPLTGDLFHFVVDDTDGDGFTDEYELANTNPPSNTALNPGDDLDSDGLTNLDEFNLNTDPNLADTDGDTLDDGAEVAGAGLRPATSPLTADTDGDGLSDAVESNTGVWAGTTDSGTNPTDVDWDKDGLSDGAETNTGTLVDRFDTGTDPYAADTDADGAGDWYEVAATFTDPHSAASTSPIPYPLPDPDGSTGDPVAPVKVYIMAGQSNTVGIGHVTGTEPGTLETIAKRENRFPNLVDASNEWTVRNDVIYKGVVTATAAGPLTPGQGASSTQLGPELGFGQVMGWHHDEPVLILKASQGNRSLGWDFLPPGSGSFDWTDAYTYPGYGQSPQKWLTSGGGPAPGSWYAGKQYDDCFRSEADMGMAAWQSGTSYSANVMIHSNGAAYTCSTAHTSGADTEPGAGANWESYWNAYSITNAHDILGSGVLQNLPTTGNDLNGRPYEIAGFCWWQGHKDHTDSVYAPRYEENLIQLIDALRTDFNAPDAPVVVASIGFGGGGVETKPANYQLVHGAQMAVGDAIQRPQFRGSVKSIDILPYWREVEESPKNEDYHYNRSAETYMLVGDAMGRAMVELNQFSGQLAATSPADDATDAESGSDLIMTFVEDQVAGSGSLTIRNLTDGIDTVIPINDPRVTIAGNQVTVAASDLIDWETDFAIRIDTGFVQSTGGTPFSGILDDQGWNFTTGPDQLTIAVQDLSDHINGNITLTAQQIADYKLYFDLNRSKFARDAQAVTDLIALVETFDAVNGPLWIATGSFNRDTQPDDLNWTMYHVMQYIMDVIYTADNLVAYEGILDGFKFGSSARFPGSCDPPADPDNVHTVTVRASYPDTGGWERQNDDFPARRATGTYVAPGTFVTVTVPPALVGQGLQVRVGAQSWDMEARGRSTVWRLDRASLLYDIDATTVKVASPYGGGIYIEVPKNIDLGLHDIDITGAVRSPLFSLTSYHQTTVTEWQDTERHHPAPWADFRTDGYMCQVPTVWIYNYDDPTPAMQDWQLAVDTYNDLMGFPRVRGKESIYNQVDVINRSSVYAPGYPAVNVSSNDPTADNWGGDRNHFFVRGPRGGVSYFEFHEHGHAYRFPKFSGETESTVNLPHVAIMNQCFGWEMDRAHASSLGFGGNPARTVNNTAVAWMTSFGFSPREIEMTSSEKAYQLKGQGKFVDIARMFGWDKLNDFWKGYVDEYDATGVKPSPDDDTLTLDLSKAVGKDMRPLLHFWGIFPNDAAALEAAIGAEGLPASAEVYELLNYYKSLVPADNAGFQAFALAWWESVPDPLGPYTESEHGRQWDTTDWATPYGKTVQRPNGEIYDETAAAEVQARVQEIIDLYFPGGNPDPGYTSPPSPDPMSFATAPYGVDPVTISMTASPATDIQGPVEYYIENVTTGVFRDWSTDQEWTETGLNLGTSYDYRVKARDAVGNETAWSAPATATPLADLDPPSLVAVDPVSGSNNIDVFVDLTLTFDEPVAAGTGSVVIRNLTDATDTVIDIADAGQVGFAGAAVVISPASDLEAGKVYAVQVTPGAIEDVWGNDFAGITDDVSWSFSTALTPQVTVLLSEDFESPDVGAYTKGALPDNGSWVGSSVGFGSDRKGITDKAGGDFGAADPNFQGFAFRYTNSGLTSAEGVIGALAADVEYEIVADVVRDDGLNAGTPYTIQLVAFDPGDNRADCSGSRPGTVLAQTTGSAPADGSFVTANVQFTASGGDPSVGKDLGVRFMGATTSAIIDNVVVRTVNTGGADGVPPAVAGLAPADGSTDVAINTPLSVTFNEDVAIGSGMITIKNLTGASQATIDVTDGAQVSISGPVLTITPIGGLAYEADHAVRIDAGAILDLAGNPWGGIADDTTWSFTTEDTPDLTPPTLAATDIVDDRSGASIIENNLVIYTLTFSEDIDEATVDAADFGNAGSAPATLGTLVESSPGVFTLEVTPTAAGSLQLAVLAGATITDAAGNALDTTTPIADDTVITVDPANVAPVWAADPVNEVDAAEDSAYASTLADDASDADSNPLSFAKVGGPAWLVVAADGSLSGTPGQADVGTNVFTVSVSDGIAAAVEATLNINVTNVNDAPNFAADPFATADATEDAAYAATLDGSASDADGDALDYAKVSGPAWLSVAPDGSLSGTPANDDVGLNVFVVSASDGIASPVEATLEITVINVNDAPQWAADPVIEVDADQDEAYASTLADDASDDDGDPLNFAKVGGPAWLGVAANGALTGTPTSGDLGLNSFTVSVSDGIDPPVEVSLEITVEAPPVGVVFTDDFEVGSGSPDVDAAGSTGSTSRQTNTTNWVRASQGFGANDHGIVDESAGQFTDPSGEQAYAFRYTNSGLTTAEGLIGSLAAGTTYTVTFDVVGDGHNGGGSYEAQLVTFAPGAARNDARAATPGTSSLLASQGGSYSATTYQEVGFSYVADGSEGALGDDIALRFIGASTSANIDNVRVQVIPPADATPPTLAAADIVDDQAGGPVTRDDLVTYTVTFSEDMDETSVDATDFSNAGSSAITLGTITETSPGVFSVEVTPTEVGSLQLQVGAGAVLTDVAGNALDTSVAIVDDTTLTVDPVMVPVPDVVGLAQAAAESAITGAQLTVGNVTTEYSDTVPAGDVISQGPGAGSSVPEDSAVDLVVSLGVQMVTVPDVVGLAQAAAESAITGALLTVGNVTTEYSDTVPAGNVISQGLGAGSSVPVDSSVDLVVSLGLDLSPKLVRTTVSGVASDSWTTVGLGRTYNSPVIIATPIYPIAGLPPVVTRITNVTSTGFDVKVDRADGLTDPVSIDVSVVVVDEGVYTQAVDGVTMEAVKYTSTVTADNNSWVADSRTFQNSYTSPVVVGQVMSANDPNWSVFWSMGSGRNQPVDASNLNVGKHVGEDPDAVRADEVIGYIVIESGSGSIEGVAYEAALGADTIRGFGNSSSPYTYALGGSLASASTAAASISGMDGNNGAWAVLSGSPALTAGSIGLHACEDQLSDSEQSHTTTQVGYIVFE